MRGSLTIAAIGRTGLEVGFACTPDFGATRSESPLSQESPMLRDERMSVSHPATSLGHAHALSVFDRWNAYQFAKLPAEGLGRAEAADSRDFGQRYLAILK